MIYFSKVQSFFSPDLSNFLRKEYQKCLDLFTRIFFHLRLLWNKKEREEYWLFSQVKTLSFAKITTQTNKLFKEKIHTLCQRFTNEDISTHIKRLNHGKLDYQPYFHSSGDEKVVIKAHEVFEMLAMKWEHGVPFDRDRFSAFCPAHRKAIQVENTFFQILALEKNLVLSRKAFEYCRLGDDLHLTYPIDFYNGKLNLEVTQTNLTKNSHCIPHDGKEIDAFCTFFSQMKKNWDPRYRIGLYQRFLFSRLQNNYLDSQLYLIVLLRALEGDDIYHKYSVNVISKVLDIHLKKYNLSKYLNKKEILDDEYFFVKDPSAIPWQIAENYQALKKSFT